MDTENRDQQEKERAQWKIITYNFETLRGELSTITENLPPADRLYATSQRFMPLTDHLPQLSAQPLTWASEEDRF